jgi:hypothetical protein
MVDFVKSYALDPIRRGWGPVQFYTKSHGAAVPALLRGVDVYPHDVDTPADCVRLCAPNAIECWRMSC